MVILGKNWSFIEDCLLFRNNNVSSYSSRSRMISCLSLYIFINSQNELFETKKCFCSLYNFFFFLQLKKKSSHVVQKDKISRNISCFRSLKIEIISAQSQKDLIGFLVIFFCHKLRNILLLVGKTSFSEFWPLPLDETGVARPGQQVDFFFSHPHFKLCLLILYMKALCWSLKNPLATLINLPVKFGSLSIGRTHFY